MKDKIEPYCKWCKDEMCVYAECPACGDYCPVPNLPRLCRFEEREDMTPKKAWGNIADRLRIYAGEHGFTDEDKAAEVMAFRVLSAAEEEMKVLNSFLFRCWQMGWLKQYDDTIEGGKQ